MSNFKGEVKKQLKNSRGLPVQEDKATLESGEAVAEKLKELIPKGVTSENIVFACIGSDRSTGDSLGPIVGTRLKELGYEVVGDLNETLHAKNLDERIEKIPSDKFIIAVDCALTTNSESLDKIGVRDCPIKPGAGVGKNLTPVGDISIVGCLTFHFGDLTYFLLSNVKLSKVMDLASKIVEGIARTVKPHKEGVKDYY